MRLGGAKGLLALMSPADAALYPGVDIVLRKSMIKSRSDPLYSDDVSLRTIDVVRYNSLRIGTSLGSEAIIAMVHGGVPSLVFLDMMAHCLDELRDALFPTPLGEETTDDVRRRFIANVHRLGGVGAGVKRRQLVQKGLSTKVAGLTWETTEVDVSDTPDDDSGDVGGQYEVDLISKLPGSIAEW